MLPIHLNWEKLQFIDSLITSKHLKKKENKTKINLGLPHCFVC